MDPIPHTFILVNLEDASEEVNQEVRAEPEMDHSEQERNLHCKLCSLWFRDLLEYIRHHTLVKHHSPEPFKCLLCRRKFSSREWLEDHYTVYHRVALKEVACLEDQSSEEVEHQGGVCHKDQSPDPKIVLDVVPSTSTCLEYQDQITNFSENIGQNHDVEPDGCNTLFPSDESQNQEVVQEEVVICSEDKEEEEHQHVDHSYYRLETDGDNFRKIRDGEELGDDQHYLISARDRLEVAEEDLLASHDSRNMDHSDMANHDVASPYLDNQNCADRDVEIAVDPTNQNHVPNRMICLQETDGDVTMDTDPGKQLSNHEIACEEPAVPGSSLQDPTVLEGDAAIGTSVEEPHVHAGNVTLRTSDGRDVYVIDQPETSFTAAPSLEVTIQIDDDPEDLDQSNEIIYSPSDGIEDQDQDEGCLDEDDDVLMEGDGHSLSGGDVIGEGESTTEDDFQFISGLKHRRLHITNTNLVTDIGLQVFICLHCDFVSNEDGLVSHMKTTHQHKLTQKCHEGEDEIHPAVNVPSNRLFPQDVTGEEVLWLSEYHRRNLEQKVKVGYESKKKQHLADKMGSGQRGVSMIASGSAGSKGAAKTKKKYQESRMPCLCPECGKMLCRKSALRTHMLGVHSRVRNHLCEVCGKAFRSANQLSQHRKTHRKKVFACDACDFTSDVRTAIFDHQQLHPSTFWLCHVCGTVVKSKTALTRHMTVHSMSRPYPCTVEGCTWRFKSKVLCKGHVEAHRSQGKFVCLECKRHFRKRHHVRRHLTAVHGVASKSELDSNITMDAKAMPSPGRFSQLPVTQLSKQHIMITTDEHGNPIFGEDSEELVFDAKAL